MLNGIEIFRNSITNHPNTFRIEIKKQNEEVEVITLKSKTNDNRILLDLFRKGELFENNVGLKWGDFKNKNKRKGMKKLEDFDLKEAQILLKKGLELIPYDAEIYFYLACINSLNEEIEEGMRNLESAIKHGYTDKEKFETYDKLAYLRMQDQFSELMKKIG
jgi:tetratricopeptide (TPR) repeat protein